MPFWDRTRIASLLLAGCAGAFVCFRRADLSSDRVPLDLSAMREMARLGEGLLVWERNVGGNWQIWMKSLDGAGEEQRLVPEEAGHDHFCPKFSPDGALLAYMSYPRGQTAYEAGVGKLWILDVSTRKRTQIAVNARSYREDRAVVWFDNHRLCHVDEKGNAVEIDLTTGNRTPLTKTPHKNGWLVNSLKTHATSGDPEFALLRADGGVQSQPRHGGCQPYFSHDGRWGFWMGGPGGPLNKMFLPTRAVGQILDLDDSRLPPGRNYIYFPMLSACQRLMAFAASPDDHDHFQSNYDLFVIRVNPRTLEPIGKPVRYTAFDGTDRFPDVFCRPLPLGSQYVEGPTRLEFQARDAAKGAHWTVDGSNAGAGPTLTREFAQPGDHWVEAAMADGTMRRGLVHVSEPKAPAILHTSRTDHDTLSITFDEAVRLDGAKAMAQDGNSVAWGTTGAGNHTVSLLLPPGAKEDARITLRGIRDLSQLGNAMPATTLHLPPAGWPQRDDALVFAWENRNAAPPGSDFVAPQRSGKAFWNSRGGMDVRGGVFELPDVGTRMVHECGRSGAFTLEAIIAPMVPPFDKAMRPVLSLEDEAGRVHLALLQLRSSWSLWLATDDNPRGTSREQSIMPIRAGQPHHVVLGYEAGRFVLFVDGAEVWVRSQLNGALRWQDGPARFRIGACSKLTETWQGMVEQLSVHSRVLTASEALASAHHAKAALATQSEIKTRKVVARLVQSTPLPKLEDIRPYREALVEQLYEVLPKDDGDDEQSFPVGSHLAVTHWVWVNAEAAQAPPAKIGDTFRLFVQPRQAHGEVSSLVIRSNLPVNPEVPAFLDVSNW